MVSLESELVPAIRFVNFFNSLHKFFFPFLDEARNKDEGVLVHCYGGMSRSPTIIMAYLMRKLNFTANEVYHFATSRERLIRPNLYFRKQLSVYEEALRRNVNSRRLTLSRAERLFRETPENDIPPQEDDFRKVELFLYVMELFFPIDE
ncbi:UNVERIFIED_CONTAM: Dusp7 [Trichonephila clavipes]